MKENNFDGIWMQIKHKDFYGENSCLIFNGDKGVYFDFETDKGDVLHLKETNIGEDISKGNFEFIASDRLKIFKKGIKSTFYADKMVSEEIAMEDVFIRLEPTKIGMAKDEIQSLEYSVKWSNETLKIVFNKILDTDIIREMKARLGKEGRKILLEQFRDTLFLSIFDDNEREKLIPIKEIDQDKIILAGFPSEPFEAVGVRIN